MFFKRNAFNDLYRNLLDVNRGQSEKSRTGGSDKNKRRAPKSSRLRLEALEDRQLLDAAGLFAYDNGGVYAPVLATTGADVPSTVVTTNIDVVDDTDGLISLREAINNASNGDTITFAPSMKDKKIILSNGQLPSGKSITIDALNLYDEGAPGVTIDGNGGKIINTRSKLTIKGIRFTNGGGGRGDGTSSCGAIEFYADFTVSYCVFTNCDGGDARYTYGGAIKADECNVSIDHCVFDNNKSGQGGAVRLWDVKSVSISDTLFVNNKAVSNDAGGQGGAIYIRAKDNNNNTFFTNVTIYGNSASGGCGGVYMQAGTATLRNTIIVGNTGGDGSGSFNAYYSILPAQWNGNNNIVCNSTAAKSLFVNADNGDYRLAPNSQAIDKGYNDYVTSDRDLAGNRRKAGPELVVGSGSVVDIGAYEFALVAPTLTVEDTTFNSITVNVGDVGGANSYILQYADSIEALEALGEEEGIPVNVGNNIVDGEGIVEKTRYFFRVKAKADGFTDSDWSTTVSALAADKLKAPTLSAEATETTITVNVEPVANASVYVLEYSENENFVGATATNLTDDLTYTVSGLTPNTPCFFRVKATADGYNESEWANLSTKTDVKTWFVTRNDDSNVEGTLRYALSNAGSGEKIAFDPVAFADPNNRTISLSNPLPANAVTIDAMAIYGEDGPGLKIDANNIYTFFQSGFSMTFKGIEFTRGRSYGDHGSFDFGANFTASYCVFSSFNGGKWGSVLYSGGENGHVDEVSIDHCVFKNNTASERGGALHFANTSKVTITDSILVNNVANGSGKGGAIFISGGELTLTNVTVADNVATTGTVCLENQAKFVLNNSIFISDYSNDVYMTVGHGTSLDVHMSLIKWDPVDTAITKYESSWKYNSSLPLFVDAANGDYRLSSEPGSQAIDLGSNSYVTNVATAKDLAGNARVEGGKVDVGAYEYYLAAPKLTVVEGAATDSTITVSVGAVAKATDYALQYATSNDDSTEWIDLEENKIVKNEDGTLTVSGLDSYTTYYFRVKAKADNYDDSDYSDPVETKTRLATPTLTLVGTPKSASVDVAVGPVNGATEYALQYVEVDALDDVVDIEELFENAPVESVTAAELAEIPENDGYSVGELNSTTTYFFRVQAKAGDDDKSEWSDPLSATTALSAPTLSVVADSATDSTIALEIGTVAKATGYVLEYAKKGEDDEFEFISGVESKTLTVDDLGEDGVYVVSGLDADTTYCFRVAATASDYADSDWSKAIEAKTDKPLVAPELYFSDITTRTITVNVDNKDERATGYVLQYRATNAPESATEDVPENGIVTDLAPNTEYSFFVKATKDGYADSEWKTFTATTAMLQLAYPTLTFVKATDVTITINVGEVATDVEEGAVQGTVTYELQYVLATEEFPEEPGTTIDSSGNHRIADNLAAGKAYKIRVRANADGYKASEWATITPSTDVSLAAPELIFGETTAKSISLNVVATGKEDGYVLEYTKASKVENGSVEGDFSNAENVTTTSLTVDDLANGNYVAGNLDSETTYYFRVKATAKDYDANAAAWGYGDETTVAKEQLAAPQLSFVATTSSITVTVENVDANATGYVLQYAAEGEDFSDEVISFEDSADSYTVTGLAADTTYNFRVMAKADVNGDYADSDWTDGSKTTLAKTKLPAPQLSFVATTSSITVTVENVDSNADGYVLQYAAEGEDFSDEKIDFASSYAVTGLAADTTYNFRVMAKADVDGDYADSVWTDGSKATSAKEQLANPELRFVSSTTDTITVRVSKVEGATGYVLEYKGETDANFGNEQSVVFANESETKEVVVEGLVANTTYSFRVTASAGDDYLPGESDVLTAKTAMKTLAKPTLSVDESATTDSTISVGIGSVAGAAQFVLQYSASDDFSDPRQYTEVVYSTAGVQTVEGLAANTTYSFRVQAINEGNYVASDWATASAKTNPKEGFVLLVNTLDECSYGYKNDSAHTLRWTYDYNDDVVSLREAIQYAQSKNIEDPVIKFASNLSGTITLWDTLTINKPITIDGGNRIILDGNEGIDSRLKYNQEEVGFNAHRMFTISSNTSGVELKNITLQNVNTVNGSSGNLGGVIYLRNNAEATLTNVTVKNNTVFHSAIANEVKSNVGYPAVLTVVDCAFDNNDGGSTNAGAIQITDATLNVKGGSFSGNAGSSGGAIWVERAQIMIDGTTFDSNKATGQVAESPKTEVKNGGGAVYAVDSTISVVNAEFDGNLSTRQGGAIRLVGDASVCTVENTTFRSNQNNGANSESVGGAIYVEAGSLDVSGSTFEYNAANVKGAGGGAIYVAGGTLASESGTLGTFTGNTAAKGGAIYVAIAQNGGDVEVKGGSFEGNVANEGGAIYVYSGPFAAANSSFEANEAKDGGAIYVGANYTSSVYSAPTVSIDAVAFSENVAENNGGALYVWKGTVAVNGGAFEENEATNGGALYNVSDTTLTKAVMSSNSADNGGAACAAGGTINVDGASFNGNVATKYGGAAYVLADAKLVVNGAQNAALLSGNKATRGGAIANYGTVEIDAASFTGNVATPMAGTSGSFGGALYNTGTVTIGANSGTTTFDGNKATHEEGTPVVKDGVLNGYSGGAIYNSKGTIIADNVTFTGNFAGKYGGAISNFAEITIKGTFENNVAAVGGAVQSSGTAILDGCSFAGNTALKAKSPVGAGSVDFGGNGGAIFASGSGKSVTITGATTFDGNQAANAGGAIDYISGSLAFNGGQTTFKNNVARAVGGAVVAAGKVDFTGGVSSDSFAFSGNKAATIAVDTVNGAFHVAGETGQTAAGFYAPNVAITCDVRDEDIRTIATSFFTEDDAYVDAAEGKFNRENVDTFIRYKATSANTLKFADLKDSFDVAPRIIYVTVERDGELVTSEPIALTSSGSVNLEDGYNVVRYSADKTFETFFRMNVMADGSTSLSVSKIDVEGLNLGGGDLPVGVAIQLRSSVANPSPAASWKLSWGDGKEDTINNYGLVCNAYHVYDKGDENVAYSLTITTIDSNGAESVYENAAQFYVAKRSSTDDSGAKLDAEEVFFADLDLVDELFDF
ncbi:MAG: fibronectin type III domain-containing protein [Thermoguttaceae bacterium]|nr:fibronectin type III domain-containing protein [Thermoguttaceae bacterium]